MARFFALLLIFLGGCARYFDAVGQFVDGNGPGQDGQAPTTDLGIDAQADSTVEEDSSAPDISVDFGADGLGADSEAGPLGDCKSVSIVFPTQISAGAIARIEFTIQNNSPETMNCYEEITVFEETPTFSLMQQAGFDKTLDPAQQVTTFVTLDRTIPDGQYTVKGCVYAVGPPPLRDRVPRDSNTANNCLEQTLTITP